MATPARARRETTATFFIFLGTTERIMAVGSRRKCPRNSLGELPDLKQGLPLLEVGGGTGTSRCLMQGSDCWVIHFNYYGRISRHSSVSRVSVAVFLQSFIFLIAAFRPQNLNGPCSWRLCAWRGHHNGGVITIYLCPARSTAPNRRQARLIIDSIIRFDDSYSVNPTYQWYMCDLPSMVGI